MQSPAGPRVQFDGREMDYFSGTGYLGLQNHPQVIAAAHAALARYGLSTATSRGGFGEHPLYDELEAQVCAFFDAEKALYFASGYMGSAILTQATGCAFDHIFIDSMAHFSLWDAAQATNKPITPFVHRKPESLEEHLKRDLLPGERPLVLSDGLFPISGEMAPLPQYLALVEEPDGLVYIDDAHAVGVLGPNGRGTADHYQVTGPRLAACGTLSKALGGYGGVLWGVRDWIDALDRASRVLTGSSPPPLVLAAASACALEIARSQPGLRRRLAENVARARQGLCALGWPLEDTPSPILCLGSRDRLNLEHIRRGLFEKGIAVSLVRNYTSTPPGGALRLAIFATHTTEQIDRLVEEMGRLV